MSYTTKNTKDSPIKNTKMSHTSKTKLDYTPTPTKIYKITGFDIYDYDNAYGQHNTTMLKRCNPVSGNSYYCQDTRKEILEYLLENEEDVEDGGRKATDYKLMEEELAGSGDAKINPNDKEEVKALGREVLELCAKTDTCLQLLVCELQSQLNNDRYLELVATKKEEREEVAQQERRASWMARKERCFDSFGNEL